MGTSTTSNSAQNSGAAKDDVVGLDGDLNFTISDLLANDPGSAAKNGIATGFFFGNITDYANNHYGLNSVINGMPTLAAQIAYLKDHGIIANLSGDHKSIVSLDITADGKDIDYMVQMGNKGTWSVAHVDVHAPLPPPPVIVPPLDTHHAGDQIAMWNFEDNNITDARGYQDFSAPNGWINVSTYAGDHGLGTYADQVQVVHDANGIIKGYGAGEHQWLDTAGSPGNIWIQLSDANRANLNIQHDAQLTFSVAKQQFGDGTGGSNGDPNSHTDPNASVDILWNYQVVATVKASDLADFNHFHDFSVIVHADDTSAHDQLMIRSSGTDATAQGLAIDHIALNDWVI